MTLTTYGPDPTQQAGFVKIAIGESFASLKAPKLTELIVDATCAITAFGTNTDVSYKERQDLCMKDAKEWLDKRVRKLDPMTIRAAKTQQDAVIALLAEDAQVRFFVRPYDSSDTPLAVGDKGWSFTARVAKLDPTPLAVGNDYEWTVEFYDVNRSLEAALVA